MKFDAMLYAVCRRTKLRAALAGKLGMVDLRWSSARLLIRLAEAGGSGLLAHVCTSGEFVEARKECVKLGLIVEGVAVNDGTLGSTHPRVMEIALTDAGRAIAGPGLAYLQRLAERVASVK